MYQASKQYIKDAVGTRIDAALSVAESAVDRFLPEEVVELEAEGTKKTKRRTCQ